MTHRFQGYDHPALYKMINSGPGPAASAPQTEFWAGLSNQLSQIDTDLNNKLQTLKATWQGSAGDSAQGGMTPLQQWASDAQSGTDTMRASSELQGTYIGQARASMPEPVQVTTPAPSAWQVAGAVVGGPIPALIVAAQAADHESQERAKAEAEQKAVDTMNTYQASTEWNTSTLGTFVPPPDVVVETGAPAGGISGGTVGSSSAAAAGIPVGGGTSAQGFVPAGVPGGGPGGGAPFPGGQPGGPTVPSGGNPGPLPSTGPGNGFPQGPGGTGPGGSGPFAPGTGPFRPGTDLTRGGRNGRFGNNPFGPGGRGPGIGGPGGPGGPGAGRGIPGGGFGTTPVDADGRGGRGGIGGAGSLAEGASGRGAPGAGGFGAGGPGRGGAAGGPPGAGGRGAKGEGDDEHETPDYLMETADVFGDERMVAPPVIGESRGE